MIKDIDKFPRFTQKTTGFAHQDKELGLTWNRSYYGYLWEQGTGKSKPVVDTAAMLFLDQQIDGLLIIAPKGSYKETWVEQVRVHLMEGLPHRIAAYNAIDAGQGHKRHLNMLQLLRPMDDVLDILLMNIEGLSYTDGPALRVAMQFVLSHYTMVVVDESSYIKNPKAIRTKACFKLGEKADYRRILSGTPITQSPLDVFAQCQFLQPGSLGFRTFTEFKAHHADTIQMKMGPRMFPKVVGYKNLDELTVKLNRFTSRILKKDCLDLPEKVYQTHYVEMTPEQQVAYNKIRDEAIIQLDSGDQVTALNALTTLNKLQQIACGHVKTDDGQVLHFPHNRAQAVLEILDLLADDRKVIIWCNYQQDVVNVMNALRDVGREPLDYYGETSDSDRELHLKLFLNDPNYRDLVATPGVGGRSLTLTVASYSIYYSNGFNLEHRLQSEDRLHRIGQRNPVTYVDLICRGTVDTHVVKRLKEKKQLADTVLDDYRELLLGSGD